MSKADEDIVLESSRSTPGRPAMSSGNPGTPRSVREALMRDTPPPGVQATPPPRGKVRNSPKPTGQHSQSVTPAAVERQYPPQSKYDQLLHAIEYIGQELRPTHAGSKASAERLKRGIAHARTLVRECCAECEREARS